MSKVEVEHVSAKSGLPPGSLVYVGQEATESVQVEVIDYNADRSETRICQAGECASFKSSDSQTWINVVGLNTSTLEQLGKDFGLDNLILEDILNTRHRPKAEFMGGHLFVILKMLHIDKDSGKIKSEQMSLVLGQGYVISFQEKPGDVLDGLRTRLGQEGSMIRKKTVDFLLYRIIDCVVDNYYLITEHLGATTEKLEQRIYATQDDQAMRKIRRTKQQLIALRRAVYPLREAVHVLMTDEESMLLEETHKHFSDVKDHILHVIEFIEIHREMVDGVMDLYLSGQNDRLNQSMKILTIVSTIFIPPTFIAGMYGMNFEYIPELSAPYGYFIALSAMVLCAVGMIIIFKKRKLL